jgi:hypothetical protein
LGLFLLTIILLIITLKRGNQAPSLNPQLIAKPTQQPIPANAKSVLSLLPNPVSVDKTGYGSLDVELNTNENTVTAVQLELQYDPKTLTNVTITAGPFLNKPIELLKNIDRSTGRITFMLGITPAQQPIQGKGIVATVTFSTLTSAKNGTTDFKLLPSSLVTASGIDTSVLRSTLGTKVTLSEE